MDNVMAYCAVSSHFWVVWLPIEKRDKKLRGTMVKDVHLAHIYIEKLIKKQRSFVKSSE